jgi:hypothetical protein
LDFTDGKVVFMGLSGCLKKRKSASTSFPLFLPHATPDWNSFFRILIKIGCF